MPIRDVVLTAFIFGTLPFILRRPYIGVLVWTWLGFMNPHRLTWGFAYEMPFALIVAVTTLIGMLMSREPKKIPWTRETTLLALFVAFMFVTTLNAYYPDLAWEHFWKIIKIQLMIFVTLILMQSKERINLLVWVMALSIGFYGVKGGIFTIATGGAFHVRGPEGSFIGGDNEIGLALCMTIPLLRYLQMSDARRWVRALLGIAMVLSAIAAAGTQSRGAMLGLAGMAAFLWLKTRHKISMAVMGAIGVFLVLTVMPQQWYDRMSTIRNYQSDASAMGRINAWHMAFNLARDRPLGAGFDAFRETMFERYAPNPGDVHDSHSIYFEVLGEHGFGGLGLFLALGIATWFTASWIIRRARRNPEDRWAADLAAMIQVSLVAFGTAGAFLGLAYFDYYYTLIAVIVLTKTVLVANLAQRSAATAVAQRVPQGSPLRPGVPRPARLEALRRARDAPFRRR